MDAAAIIPAAWRAPAVALKGVEAAYCCCPVARRGAVRRSRSDRITVVGVSLVSGGVFQNKRGTTDPARFRDHSVLSEGAKKSKE